MINAVADRDEDESRLAGSVFEIYQQAWRQSRLRIGVAAAAAALSMRTSEDPDRFLSLRMEASEAAAVALATVLVSLIHSASLLAKEQEIRDAMSRLQQGALAMKLYYSSYAQFLGCSVERSYILGPFAGAASHEDENSYYLKLPPAHHLGDVRVVEPDRRKGNPFGPETAVWFEYTGGIRGRRHKRIQMPWRFLVVLYERRRKTVWKHVVIGSLARWGSVALSGFLFGFLVTKAVDQQPAASQVSTALHLTLWLLTTFVAVLYHLTLEQARPRLSPGRVEVAYPEDALQLEAGVFSFRATDRWPSAAFVVAAWLFFGLIVG